MFLTQHASTLIEMRLPSAHTPLIPIYAQNSQPAYLTARACHRHNHVFMRRTWTAPHKHSCFCFCCCCCCSLHNEPSKWCYNTSFSTHHVLHFDFSSSITAIACRCYSHGRPSVTCLSQQYFYIVICVFFYCCCRCCFVCCCAALSNLWHYSVAPTTKFFAFSS